MNPSSDVFTLQVGYDQTELLGARWWHEAHGAPTAAAGRGYGDADSGDRTRRQALIAMFALVGGAAVFGIAATRCGRTYTTYTDRTSLDLQREQGLTVGSDLQSFAWLDTVPTDAAGAGLDRTTLPSLVSALRPSNQAYTPFYVPTLFQSLSAPGSQKLLETAACVDSPAMRIAFARGRALRELIELAERPERWAIVVDLPGPESVAFAAALAPAAEAVFTFDNWPHPRGVVPAHLTLGAVLFHRPHFLERGSTRVPPVFVLDRMRLAALTGSTHEFDNRYRAKLPSARSLQELGIERVLYVIPEGAPERELDDLNEDFVAWRGAGITIAMLGLHDLQLVNDPNAPAPASSSSSSTSGHTTPRYYWNGSAGRHYWFWNHYGWPSRPGPVMPERPVGPLVGTGYQPTARPIVRSALQGLGHTQQQQTSTSRYAGGSWGRSISGGGWS